MGNMSYCRFQNTLADLWDCEEHLDAALEGDEDAARRMLIKTCQRIAAEWGSDGKEGSQRADLLAAAEAADEKAQVLYIAVQHVKQSQCVEYLIALNTAAREFGDAWAVVQAAIARARGE